MKNDDSTTGGEVSLDVTAKSHERLFFCETLIEEYESMLEQPPLDQTELNKIKADINAYRKNLKGVSQSDSGKVIKRIYHLFNKAQRDQAKNDGPEKTSPGITADNGHQQGNGTGIGPARLVLPKGEKLAACAMRSALCLSGGGIRSATFNLGILQGLARHGLLEKFDYLSTVSGGGFIGGWLSAWIRRAGLTTVANELKKPPATPLKPDPDPVEHLRIYSNYLSPQPGLLSADTWTLVASVVRNLLLNWLVFVPVILALLLLPRMWASIVLRSTLPQYSWYAVRISLLIAFISGVWALSYIGRNLPSANKYSPDNPNPERYKGGQGKFIAYCLIWLVICAGALAVYLWVAPPRPWLYYAGFLVAVSGLSWLSCFWKIGRITPKEKKTARYFWMVLATTVLIVGVVPLVIGFLANYVILLALPVFHRHAVLYSVFSVPFILLLMGLKAVLIAGFASRFSKDDDQEWWARGGAWVLIVAIAWSVVHLLVLYGPLLLITLGATYRALQRGGLSELTWSDWGKVLATLAGIVSGAVTLFGGTSAKTPANSKEAQKVGTGGLILALATQLLAPIFLGFLIIVLSFVTNWIIISWPSRAISQLLFNSSVPTLTYPLSGWHIKLLEETTLRHLLILSVLLTLIGTVMGRLISTNVFSLQYLWRNRIIRAYLGASHLRRDPDPFTGFDSYDNLQMHELWRQPGSQPETYREDRPAGDLQGKPESRKLFHILNIALNLTGGEKLQWQDRKAESFTVSPLHAGSYWLGYRRSRYYGGDDGITLGASIAVSGAFVSPNMGFMMTSPVVRFLMAIFNVRFGWWFGNPGPAGDKIGLFDRPLSALASMFDYKFKRPFCLDSPRLSILPFFNEAIGNTDDKARYVYLSDGGHFENLGLYEMVLRRCRFIVVCDATTDPDYSFESLAMSIRQIRVDLGVPIEIPEMAVGVPSQNLKSKYCAIGRIRYSCVDNAGGGSDDDYDGVLIFIKPSLIGQEPRDVINYWQGRGTFPQETITDQWFSEAQFESYRALGSYIIEAICEARDKKEPMTLEQFAQRAHEHNLLNFDAFQEHIGLVALEHAFKSEMQFAVHSYKDKVREFMNKVLR